MRPQLTNDGQRRPIRLNLATSGKAYRIELEDCFDTPTKVELYGSDPSTPLAIGAAPVDPGPHHVCRALEIQIDAPVTGRLILTDPGDGQNLVFD
ncbi:MAG: hypothetical protein ABUL62_03260 [Myxococcales bacterium]